MGTVGYYILFFMSLTVARNKRVRNVLTHASLILLTKINTNHFKFNFK